MEIQNETQKTALVLGAGGFIGNHMVKFLVSKGYWVRGVDLKKPEFGETSANEFIQGDLRDSNFVKRVLEFKGKNVTFIIRYLTNIFFLFMKFINLQLIWEELVLFLQEKMTQILCIIQQQLI